jgi:hypothetical protein
VLSNHFTAAGDFGVRAVHDFSIRHDDYYLSVRGVPGEEVAGIERHRKWSEAKFGTLLFCHCPLHGFDFILDPHKVITVELTGGSSLNALDQGAAAADELVTEYR